MKRRALAVSVVLGAASCASTTTRWLAHPTDALCDVTLPQRAEVVAPARVPSLSVSLPDPDADLVLDVLRCCTPSQVHAPLELGSYTLRVRGAADDGLCDLMVDAETEGAGSRFLCHVERPDTWGGWTEGTTAPTAALREHCDVVDDQGSSKK